jgi:hypothetical protein
MGSASDSFAQVMAVSSLDPSSMPDSGYIQWTTHQHIPPPVPQAHHTNRTWSKSSKCSLPSLPPSNQMSRAAHFTFLTSIHPFTIFHHHCYPDL